VVAPESVRIGNLMLDNHMERAAARQLLLRLEAEERANRKAKFGKTRALPLHDSTIAALEAYLRLRDARRPAPQSEALLISQAGTRLIVSCVGHTFRTLVGRAGLKPRSARCRPRPHDLRHSFGTSAAAAGIPIRTLQHWMGHASILTTERYAAYAPNAEETAMVDGAFA